MCTFALAIQEQVNYNLFNKLQLVNIAGWSSW